MGPDGTLSSTDLAGILFPAIPAGIPSSVRHVGTCGTLSRSDYNSVVLVDPGGTLSSDSVCPTRMLSSSVCECTSLLGPVGLLPPCYDGTELVPIAPTGELSSVEAVPFPGERDPVIKQLPAEMLVGDFGEVGSRDVPGISCRTVPGGLGDPAVVAMIGLDTMPVGERIQFHGASMNAEWDIRDEFETIDGMPVYYGGDLCDSIGRIRGTLHMRKRWNIITWMPWMEWS